MVTTDFINQCPRLFRKAELVTFGYSDTKLVNLSIRKLVLKNPAIAVAERAFNKL